MSFVAKPSRFFIFSSALFLSSLFTHSPTWLRFLPLIVSCSLEFHLRFHAFLIRQNSSCDLVPQPSSAMRRAPMFALLYTHGCWRSSVITAADGYTNRPVGEHIASLAGIARWQNPRWIIPMCTLKVVGGYLNTGFVKMLFTMMFLSTTALDRRLLSGLSMSHSKQRFES